MGTRNINLIQIYRICGIILILSILVKFSPSILIYGNENLKFIFLSFFKILLIVITIFWLQKYNKLNKKFYLKNSGYFFFISIILIFYVVHSNENFIETQESFKNLKHSFFLLYYLSVGIFEELFFRVLIFGLLFKYFGEKNKFKAVLFCSLIFALFHLVNLFDSQFVKISIINQVLYAFAVGLIFQSLLIKLNNIILISVIHGLLNYRSMFGSEFVKLNDISDVPYDYNQFFLTFILFISFILIIALPVSYFSSKDISNKIFCR